MASYLNNDVGTVNIMLTDKVELRMRVCTFYLFICYTVVPLYVATLTRGHPSYKATISENTPCITVSTIPLTKGHPSN